MELFINDTRERWPEMQLSFHLQITRRARANKQEKKIYDVGESRRLHTNAAESRKDWIYESFTTDLEDGTRWCD